ncbi:FAD-binding protein [Paraburkholderia sp. EG286B]|uniref:FAD-binding protein n=1 Tax=Paraburkholderia sp. EG286B TaxID=3237011 RepID=UPI0034D2A1C4
MLVAIKGEFRKSGATFHSVAEVGAFNVPDDAGKVGDGPDVFVEDILNAAQDMADPRLARILAQEAGDAMQYLEKYGVTFEKSGNGYLVFQACFSSRPRSHVIPEHFKPIVKALGQEASRRQIGVLDRTMIVDLIVRDGQCVGVIALGADGVPLIIRSKSTILTTGGASQIFAKNLYPSHITGDGYAMAYPAGARLANLEFMQAGVSTLTPFVNLFGNYLWDAQPRLTDRNGKPFLADYLPAGLSPEAVIAQKAKHFPFSASDISRYIEIAIQQAINDGRGSDEGGVYMDFIDCDFETLFADKTRSITNYVGNSDLGITGIIPRGELFRVPLTDGRTVWRISRLVGMRLGIILWSPIAGEFAGYKETDRPCQSGTVLAKHGRHVHVRAR